MLFQISKDEEWQTFIKAGYAEPVFLNNAEMSVQIGKEEASAKRLLMRAGIITDTKIKKVRNAWVYLLGFLFFSSLVTFVIYRLKRRALDNEFLVFVLLIGIPMYILYQTSFFPESGKILENGPALIPRFWSSALVLFSLLSLILYKPSSASTEQLVEVSKSLPLIIILLLTGYLAGILLIGFYASTLFFIVSVLRILKYKHLVTTVAVAFSFLLLIYLVFENLLSIKLLNGIRL